MLGLIVLLLIVIIVLLLNIIWRLPPKRDYSREMVERALENDRERMKQIGK